jgi:uncharacterized protein
MMSRPDATSDQPQIEYRFRPPKMAPEVRGGRPPKYSRTVEDGMIIERDVAVSVRTGSRVFVDVFRPLDDAVAAPLVSWMPYGKHNPLPIQKIFPDAGVKDEWTSAHTAFECPDPVYWVAHGYAVVLADIPGTWNSEGAATYCSPEEAEAFYDLIEWTGTQPWSNGKVGLSGVSYLTVAQWRVAELNPPHLAAINPYEGWTDTYREVVRHGGIPSTSFWPYLWERWGASRTEIEDLEREAAEHPFYDDFWISKTAKLDKIRTPAYVVASWGDQGLHTRGTLEGFAKIASSQKWLEVHGDKKWAHYYEPASVERQRTFFDHYLKGIDNDISQWAPVQLAVRDTFDRARVREENEWPPARTAYTTLFLDATSRTLEYTAPDDEGTATYNGAASGLDDHRVEFDIVFDRHVDIVGHMKATLYMSAEADDMDIFVSVWKIDAHGKPVTFPYYGNFEDGAMALGWIRASHRELDPLQSTEHRPVLAHQRLSALQPHEPTRLDIEILPSGTGFEPGERLLLAIQGTDVHKYPKPLVFARHEDTCNRGAHVVHTGGQFASHLVIPVLE